MTTLRVLLFMLGSWIGGVWVTLAGYSWLNGDRSYTSMWTALSIVLAAGLAAALIREWRLGRLAGTVQ